MRDMKGTLKIEKPEKLVATLQMSCTLEQFRTLEKALGDKGDSSPLWELRNLINDLIIKAETTFYGNSEDHDNG
jgi:hypothetical protein